MSAKLPARVNTLAPAGVWNPLSLPAGDLKMGQIKGMHNEGGGDRGCIYTGRVCGGRQGLAKGAGEVETMKRRGKGLTVPKYPALPRIQGCRPPLFFALGKQTSLSSSPTPAASPKQNTHSPLKSLQLATWEGSA